MIPEEGILEEISDLRQKCSKLNAEINDLKLKHEQKVDKISHLKEMNSKIKGLIAEMDEELKLSKSDDEASLREQINQLEQAIIKTQNEQKHFILETNRLKEVEKLRSASRARQMLYTDMSAQINNNGNIPISSLILLRHDLEKELQELISKDAPTYVINRKKAQIVHLLDVTI
ncbi:hypothetical protein TVAG_339780 [Trichomonas vaginalis G3]|uniref:Uncharacterized protein n=1 Tax=Trichomonas vaginalis (strain ATCC PRA-98 / G3) TaxID=412133 RepID=A2F159_TRIV3|nr:hypothetical protein TVAGG3_0495550 [Trichomonas vaginalis G3]EAY01350.1 hypothetical protein TVAG_339780 [Trichomonas vaginalis G3]KAI5516691.1 hypothetical protein TVAGG3_0495550 [Trichomonas vaginalis G3]|eukprot:XP_001330203.1 hypothetical protein [Trichomonas vaginalis G3]